MDNKDIFVNRVLLDLEMDLAPVQLKKLKDVMNVNLANVEIIEQKNEVVVYEETNDTLAYKNYFVAKKISGVADGTLKMYKYTIDKFTTMMQKPYKDVSTNDIRVYLANRSMKDKVSNATLIRERGVLVQFFAWMTNEGYLIVNPAVKVEKIKKEKRMKKPFTEIELEHLRNACISTKEKFVIELLLSTGCRVSELISLDFENYERDQDKISVIGKGNKERYVYINAKAKVAMTHYLNEVPHISGPIICGRYENTKMSKEGIQTLLRRLSRRAGVDNVHPHRFRRTAATFALQHGMPIEQVKEFLGHENIDTTLTYAMINKGDLQAAHRKFVI